MNEKYEGFLNNAKKLKEKFDIIPLLYGSLGLEILTKTNLGSKDIDILIPEVFVKGTRWEEFKTYLESNGYVLIDLHEHTFLKDNIEYSYASIENLKEFAAINTEDIPSYQENGVK